MDNRAADRQIIEKVLAEYAAIPYAYGNVETQTVFDRASDHYLLMIVGHDGKRRVHGRLVHIDIDDNKRAPENPAPSLPSKRRCPRPGST